MVTIEPLEKRELYAGLTADFAAASGVLNKPGLGSLFGITSTNGGSDPGLIAGSTLNHSAPADKSGVPSTAPWTLANIAPILRKAQIKTTVRYADMLSGFPYQWVSLADWDAKVTGETNAIKNGFKDVLHAIAVFNEPDNTMQGAFLTDPALPAGTYDGKVNWLWTHTVQIIKGIDPTLPVMGPNYVAYYPALDASHQTRMRAFLQNAIATNTVPDVMGWHQLYSPAVNSFTATMQQYRGLETSLGLPKLPVQIEEYGYNNGKFEGIPSALIPWWAEYERNGVAYATAGVYDNGGTLGNTVGGFQEKNQQVNAGWWTHNWYKTMSGVAVPTTAAATRYAGAYEGIASYNATTKTGTLILGGPNDRASVTLKGVGGLIGNQVRVQALDVGWTEDVNEPNTTLEHGGDAVNAPTELFNKVFTADASGNVTVPLRIQDLHGYKLTVAPAAADVSPRYEAEDALKTGATVTGGVTTASNGAYVGGLGQTASEVRFTVIVPNNGTYAMQVGYATPANATQTLTVNGQTLTPMNYLATGGGLGTTGGTAVRNVALKAGVNTIIFKRSTGTVDLDYIKFPTPAKYEAESAVRTHVATYANTVTASNDGYVGGIDFADSRVAFNITVPETGLYDLTARYAAALGAATHGILVNGESQGEISYPATTNWSSGELALATKVVALRAGTNTVSFNKGTGFAELDFVTVAPDTHRYEVETATVIDANTGVYPNSYTHPFKQIVAGVNNVGAGVSAIVDVPVAGTYTLYVGYGNGLTSTATHAVTVNDVQQKIVSLPPTIGWLGSVGPDGQTQAVTSLVLAAGLNTIKLTKLTNFAELDFLRLAWQAPPMPVRPVRGELASPATDAPPPAYAATAVPPPAYVAPTNAATTGMPPQATTSVVQSVLMPERRTATLGRNVLA